MGVKGDKNQYPVDIKFDGKLRKNGDPALGASNDYQDLINMRYVPGGIRGITGGMTKINTSAPTTYTKLKTLFQLKKDFKAETHVLAQAYNSGETASTIIDNTTAIPSQGNFSATAIYTEAASAPNGFFAQAPDGHVAYCDSNASLVWGGNEFRGAFVIAMDNATPASATYKYDISEQLANSINDASNRHAFTAAKYIFVGSVRPLSGVKIYVATANTNADAIAVTYWNGTSWAAAASVTDNTSVGGKTLAQTGTITWTSLAGNAKVYEVGSTFLYWTLLDFSGCSAGTTIYQITQTAAMQQFTDIWDGQVLSLFDVERYDGTSYDNYTTNVKEDSYISTNDSTYMKLDSMATSNYLVCGSNVPLMGLIFHVADDQENTAAATATVSYWDGNTWQAVSGFQDNTSNGTATLNRGGAMSWTPVAPNTEFQTKITNEQSYYYYKVNLSAAPDGSVRVRYMAGIPAPEVIDNYKFPLFFQNRVILCSDQNDRKNKILIGGYNSTADFSGADSLELFVGDDRELIAGCTLFSRFGSTVYENVVLCKADETYILDGTSVQDYAIRKVSGTYGCVAPYSMVACDVGIDVEQGTSRNIAIWQSAVGICMFDNNTIKVISNDIHDFFNPLSSSFIPQDQIAKSYSFYDAREQEYHWCFSNTAAATVLNKEFVYSIKFGKWYEIQRGTGKALQGGASVRDTYGNIYLYGWDSSGYMQRLDNGTDFDGQNISYTMHFCDKPFYDSIMYETVLDKLKLVAVKKSTTSSTVAVTHYSEAASSASSQAITAIALSGSNRIISGERTLELPPSVFHSLKFVLSTNNENIGFEPLALSLFVRLLRPDYP